MAKYRALTGSESQLQRFTSAGSLNPARKLEAEQHADNWIDQMFSDWDLTLLSAPGYIPPAIDEVARLVATSHLIELEFSAASGRSVQSEEGSAARALKREAEKIAQRSIDQGFVIGPMGERIHKIDREKRSMQVPIRI